MDEDRVQLIAGPYVTVEPSPPSPLQIELQTATIIIIIINNAIIDS